MSKSRFNCIEDFERTLTRFVSDEDRKTFLYANVFDLLRLIDKDSSRLIRILNFFLLPSNKYDFATEFRSRIGDYTVLNDIADCFGDALLARKFVSEQIVHWDKNPQPTGIKMFDRASTSGKSTACSDGAHPRTPGLGRS